MLKIRFIIILSVSFIILFWQPSKGFSQTTDKQIQKQEDKQLEQIAKINQLVDNGKFSKVLKIIDPVIEFDNENASLHFVKAMCYENTGNTNKAITAYMEALKYDSFFVDALYNLGVIYLNSANISNEKQLLGEETINNYLLSQEYFERYYRINPQEANIRDALLFIYSLTNQDSTRVDSVIMANSLIFDTADIYMQVDKIAEFPGGETNMFNFIGRNIEFPRAAINARVSGRVFVSFIVEKDGSLTDRRIMRGIGYGCDEEVLRIISLMPKWIPALLNNKPVRYLYRMPVKFNTQ